MDDGGFIPLRLTSWVNEGPYRIVGSLSTGPDGIYIKVDWMKPLRDWGEVR